MTFHFGADPDFDAQELKQRFAHVVVAIGSWGRGQNPVQEGQDHIVDALDFLWQTQNEGRVDYGARVAVIGAGDVAMDCLRTAARLPGVEAAELVYRRTEPYMPATQHEVNSVRAQGLTMHQLLAPVSYDGTMLRVERMSLSRLDASGRRSVTGTGRFLDMPFDTVVGATGATVTTDTYTRNGLALDSRGRPVLDRNYQSSVPGVYVIGDGRQGPATIVEAIADAKVACAAILAGEGIMPDYTRPHPTIRHDADAVYQRRGLMITQINGRDEGSRCLSCQEICEICTEVCPNRANVALTVPGFDDPRQIVHLDGLCNECHTCGTFCPHAGLPYKDKLTVFWTREDFDDSTNAGFLPLGESTYLVRVPGGDVFEHDQTMDVLVADKMPDEMSRVLQALEGRYSYLLDPALHTPDVPAMTRT